MTLCKNGIGSAFVMALVKCICHTHLKWIFSFILCRGFKSECSNWMHFRFYDDTKVSACQCVYVYDSGTQFDCEHSNTMLFKNMFHFVAFVVCNLWMSVPLSPSLSLSLALSRFLFWCLVCLFLISNWHESKSGFYYSINSSACSMYTHTYILSLGFSSSSRIKAQMHHRYIQPDPEWWQRHKSHYRLRRWTVDGGRRLWLCNIVNNLDQMNSPLKPLTNIICT